MRITEIQKSLKAPKDKRNDFGGFNYRNAEGILEALKVVLQEGEYINLTDEIVEVGGRVYIKATATLWIQKDFYLSTAYAREAEAKKGMDEAQITGSASSYARKYALAGLLALDDGNDPDSKDNSTAGVTKPTSKPSGKATQKQIDYICGLVTNSGLLPDVYFEENKIDIDNLSFEKASELIKKLK
jgi:hypothetical protein